MLINLSWSFISFLVLCELLLILSYLWFLSSYLVSLWITSSIECVWPTLSLFGFNITITFILFFSGIDNILISSLYEFAHILFLRDISLSHCHRHIYLSVHIISVIAYRLYSLFIVGFTHPFFSHWCSHLKREEMLESMSVCMGRS